MRMVALDLSSHQRSENDTQHTLHRSQTELRWFHVRDNLAVLKAQDVRVKDAKQQPEALSTNVRSDPDRPSSGMPERSVSHQATRYGH